MRTLDRRGLVATLLAFLMMVLLGACATTGPERDTASKRDSVLDAGVMLAIFDFEVRSSASGFDALSADVPSALSEAFIAGKIVRPVEREALQKVIGELELSMSGLVDPVTAARAGRMAGARYVLLGTAAIVGNQIRLSCRIVDVETSEIVYAGSTHGDTTNIFEVESKLAKLVEEDFSE